MLFVCVLQLTTYHFLCPLYFCTDSALGVKGATLFRLSFLLFIKFVMRHARKGMYQWSFHAVNNNPKWKKDSRFWESKWFSKLLTRNDVMFDKDYLYFTNEPCSFFVFMKTSTSSRYQWSVLDFLRHLVAQWILCGHKWFPIVRKEVNGCGSPASAFNEAVLFRQLQRAWKTEGRWVHKKSLLGREQHKTALQTHSSKITT